MTRASEDHGEHAKQGLEDRGSPNSRGDSEVVEAVRCSELDDGEVHPVLGGGFDRSSNTGVGRGVRGWTFNRGEPNAGGAHQTRETTTVAPNPTRSAVLQRPRWTKWNRGEERKWPGASVWFVSHGRKRGEGRALSGILAGVTRPRMDKGGGVGGGWREVGS
jgi:hypothetical protein